MNKLSHYDGAGSPRMVDVSGKPETRRVARAQAFVRIRPEALAELRRNPKGNPLEIARIAGIAAAKRTSELIPLCHPLMLTHADVEASVEEGGVRIVASAATTAQTGVEMEALTAASVAALTVYDMLKALDKSIEIQDVYLLEKTGGKSGDFRREGAGIHRGAQASIDVDVLGARKLPTGQQRGPFDAETRRRGANAEKTQGKDRSQGERSFRRDAEGPEKDAEKTKGGENRRPAGGGGDSPRRRGERRGEDERRRKSEAEKTGGRREGADD